MRDKQVFAMGCVGHLFALSQLMQGRLREYKPSYVFFLDIEKAYDSGWSDGLWWRLCNKDITGTIRRVIQNMYAKTHSRVFANGCLSDRIPITHGTSQGCTLSPDLYSVMGDDALEALDVVGAGVVVQASKICGRGYTADLDCPALDSTSSQRSIDMLHSWAKCWRLKANVKKSGALISLDGNCAPPPDLSFKWGD